MAALMIRSLTDKDWTKPFDPPKKIQVTRSGFLGSKKKLTVTVENKAQEEYAAFNPDNYRQENIETIKQLTKRPLFLCLKEKFSPYFQDTDQNSLLSADQKLTMVKACTEQFKEEIKWETQLDQIHGEAARLSLKKGKDNSTPIKKLNEQLDEIEKEVKKKSTPYLEELLSDIRSKLPLITPLS
jgi:hypothetical protein